MRTGLISALMLLLPSGVLAAAYVEYAPDYSEPTTVQVGSTVTQAFKPLNDRLAAVEVWVSTGGVPASLQASLVNASGSVVSSAVVSLGAIADTSGGTRTRITFPAQIAVSGEQTYRLNLTPSGSAVKLYYSTSVAIAPGSGDGASSYSHGAAVVNGAEQGYSYKFALIENNESTNPVINNVQLSQPAIGQAVITFRSSEPVDTQTVYGTKAVPWTGEYTPCLPDIAVCAVTLKPTPGTAYTYSLTARDSWGNAATIDGSFTAIGAGPAGGATATPTSIPTQTPTPTETILINDGTDPTIINPRLVSLTATDATFAWTTDEAASSWVVILVLPELTAWSYVFDNTAELEHYIPIDNLPSDQYLRGRITSTDQFGNFSTVNIDFKTPAVGEVSSPQPSPSFSVVPTPSGSTSPTPLVTPSTTVAPSGTTAPETSASPSPTAVAYPSTSSEPGIISWPPAGGGGVGGYRIDIFDADGNLITTITVGADITSVPLPDGLPEGARIIIYADRGGAFEKVADPVTVTDRPYTAGPSPLLTPVLTIVGGTLLLAALIAAWVWQRRKQKVAVNASISTGLGGGSQAV